MNRLLLSVLLLLPCALQATTVYTTFGVNYGYISSPLYGDQYVNEFAPSSSGYLNQITLALGVSQLASSASYANVFIYANGNGTPGALLEEITVDAGFFANPNYTPDSLLVTAQSVVQPYLYVGQDYWLGVSEVAPGSNPIDWYAGSSGLQAGALEEVFYQGAWVQESPQPTVALTADITVNRARSGSATPEPATLGLVGMGLMALGLMRRRTIKKAIG